MISSPVLNPLLSPRWSPRWYRPLAADQRRLRAGAGQPGPAGCPGSSASPQLGVSAYDDPANSGKEGTGDCRELFWLTSFPPSGSFSPVQHGPRLHRSRGSALSHPPGLRATGELGLSLNISLIK